MTYFKLASYMGLKHPFIYIIAIILFIVINHTPWSNGRESFYTGQPIYQIANDGKLLNKKLSKTISPTGIWTVKPLGFTLKINQIIHQKNFNPVAVFDMYLTNRHILNVKAQEGYTYPIQDKNNLYILRIEKIKNRPSVVTFSLSRLD